MLYELFIEPWTMGAWMWRGTAAAALAASPCALLGVFLYLRRQSMIADALTHIALPGIVAAFLLTGSLDPLTMLLGAAVAGLLSSVVIEHLSKRPNIRSDAAIGIVFTAMFALGVVALTMFVKDAHIDTRCVLFGDILGISDGSLKMLALICPLVFVGVASMYRWLLMVSFDEGFARHVGVPVAWVHYGLMVATSMTTVASFEAVGAVLAMAMIVTPAATAHLLTDRLPMMLAVSILHGLLSALLGMYLSVWFELSSSGAIVVVGALLYVLAFLFAPRHGLLWRKLRLLKAERLHPSRAQDPATRHPQRELGLGAGNTQS